MSQLFTRYSQGQIYTYIGDILLAVNPFTPLTIYNVLITGGYCVTVVHKIFRGAWWSSGRVSDSRARGWRFDNTQETMAQSQHEKLLRGILSINRNKQTRYSQGQIYTYIRDILLVINPFTPHTIYNILITGGYCVPAIHQIFTGPDLHLYRRYIVGSQPIHTSHYI